MADTYTRQSPGKWKNNRTGQIVTSATDPGKAKQPTATAPAPKQKATKTILPNNTQINNVSQGVEANRAVQNEQAQTNIRINNPNYEGPDAKSQVIENPDGSYTQKVTRSAGQEQIANNQDNLSNAGLGYAQQQLGNLGQFDRARVEDAVYGQLTRDTNRNEAQDQQSFEQSLNNRGIPYSADPNSRYQNELKDFNNKYADIRQGARNQAILTGGQESRADYQNQLSGISTASQLGGGLRATNTPQFSGTSVNYGQPTDIDAALKALGINREQLNIARQRANNSGNNSGSTTNSAFGG